MLFIFKKLPQGRCGNSVSYGKSFRDEKNGRKFGDTDHENNLYISQTIFIAVS